MSNYHVGSDGSPKPCNAQPGNCPLGGAHFDSEEKTVKFAERMNEITAEKEETEKKAAQLWRASMAAKKGSPTYERVLGRLLETYQKLDELRDQEGITAIEIKYDDAKVTEYVAPKKVLRYGSAHLRGHIMRGPDQQKAGLLDDGSVSNLYIHPTEEKLEPLKVESYDFDEKMYITDDGQKFPMTTTYNVDTNELHIPEYGYAYGDSWAHAVTATAQEAPRPFVREGDEGGSFNQDEEGRQAFIRYVKHKMKERDRETLDINGEECSFLPKEEVEFAAASGINRQYEVSTVDEYEEYYEHDEY